MRSVGPLIGLALAACGGGNGPTEPAVFFPLARVTPGSLHSCGLTPAAAAYCWGSNAFAQLGDSSTGDATTPVAVHGGLSFTNLRAGRFHTCAATPGGAAYCWGEQDLGDLGDGTTSSSTTPVAVSGGIIFATVSAGGSHTCGLTSAGVAYCWGSNYDGQLGTGTSIGPQPCGSYTCSPTPVAVSGGLTFLLLSTGNSFTCGVTTAHAAYCWGYNGNGELGVGTATGPEICVSNNHCSASPVAVSGGLSIATISAGFYNTCAVTTAGKGYCWGNNDYGQLGNGTTDTSTIPVAVSGSLTFSTVSAGAVHTCGLTSVGKAYCWGFNNSGRLGNGDTTSSMTPVPVLGGHTFSVMDVGVATTCAVTRANVAYCWGSNSYGQLGNGATLDSSVPVVVRP